MEIKILSRGQLISEELIIFVLKKMKLKIGMKVQMIVIKTFMSVKIEKNLYLKMELNIKDNGREI
jgi:hypothetical protein